VLGLLAVVDAVLGVHSLPGARSRTVDVLPCETLLVLARVVLLNDIVVIVSLFLHFGILLLKEN
jgi:hypothetical protein